MNRDSSSTGPLLEVSDTPTPRTSYVIYPGHVGYQALEQRGCGVSLTGDT